MNEAAPSLWRVAVDCPLRTTLDYLPPADSSPATLQPGMRVRVPMGRREAVGLLVGPSTGSTVEASRLKAIRAPIDAEPLLDAALLELLLWTASYYHHPPGEVLFAALPAALREGKPAAAEQDWLVVTPEGQAAFAA